MLNNVVCYHSCRAHVHAHSMPLACSLPIVMGLCLAALWVARALLKLHDSYSL